eukprot:5458429-Pleurochrysis_carterae.AAC.1
MHTMCRAREAVRGNNTFIRAGDRTGSFSRGESRRKDLQVHTACTSREYAPRVYSVGGRTCSLSLARSVWPHPYVGAGVARVVSASPSVSTALLASFALKVMPSSGGGGRLPMRRCSMRLLAVTEMPPPMNISRLRVLAQRRESGCGEKVTVLLVWACCMHEGSKMREGTWMKDAARWVGSEDAQVAMASAEPDYGEVSARKWLK